MPLLSAEAHQALEQHGWAVVPNFWKDWGALREDLLSLRASDQDDDHNNDDGNTSSKTKLFQVAKIGHDGQVQDDNTPFRDIRVSETMMLAQPQVTIQNNQGSANDDGETKKDEAGNPLEYQATQIRRTDLPENLARQDLLQSLNTLQEELFQKGQKTQSQEELSLLLQEILYVYYPSPGGYYRRHCDAERGSASNYRRYSFLLYLNDPSWTAADGGQLRLHRDSGTDDKPAEELPNFIDILPTGGTMVIFRSDLVPHEVLTTRSTRFSERCAVVGWFLGLDDNFNRHDDKEEETSQQRVCDTLDKIHPESLKALRQLRDVVPRMKTRLEPQTVTPNHSTGLLDGGLDNDWGIVMASEPPAPIVITQKTYDDTDPRYWKSVATFDESGYLVTLALGGQRLRQLTDEQFTQVLLAPGTLFSGGVLTTLDLANTDLPMTRLTSLLQLLRVEAPHLTQIYLGGNGLGNKIKKANDGDSEATSILLQQLIPDLPPQLTVLDLRYNDLNGAAAGAALHNLLFSKKNGEEGFSPCLDKLYVEGNQLSDAGLEAFLPQQEQGGDTKLTSSLRELYLGQNDIGVAGAVALANAIRRMPSESRCSFPHLEKLFLEGNRIGPAGAKALETTIREAQSPGKSPLALQRLYVDNNGIGKEGSLSLGAAVPSATMIGEGAFFAQD